MCISPFAARQLFLYAGLFHVAYITKKLTVQYKQRLFLLLYVVKIIDHCQF